VSDTRRVDIANSVPGAIVLISIHTNGSTTPRLTTPPFAVTGVRTTRCPYAVFADPNSKTFLAPYGLVTLPVASGAGNVASRSPYSYVSPGC
jgi:hypothetical protein